jgi:hypothetical protein
MDQKLPWPLKQAYSLDIDRIIPPQNASHHNGFPHFHKKEFFSLVGVRLPNKQPLFQSHPICLDQIKIALKHLVIREEIAG